MAKKSLLGRIAAKAIGSALGWREGDTPCESMKDGIHCLKPSRHVEEPGNTDHGALGGKTWPF